MAAIADGTNDLAFDLTGDGLVNSSDLAAWLGEAGAAMLPSGNPFLPGDANLDGTVGAADFTIWNNNRFTSQASWCRGDFNADGVIDGKDLLIWNGNKDIPPTAVLIDDTAKVIQRQHGGRLNVQPVQIAAPKTPHEPFSWRPSTDYQIEEIPGTARRHELPDRADHQLDEQPLSMLDADAGE